MNALTEWQLKLTENVNATMNKLGVATATQAGKMDSLQSKVTGVGSAFSNLQGIIAVAGVGLFAGQALEEYQQAAAANAQLKASYISTNAAVGESYKQLQDLSDKLAATSIFDDDDITKAQSVLLTFTNIKGKVYEEALPAIADLASKMGGDLQGTVVQVGKALNDPIQGITALTRVGVSFTDQQKAIIKHYVDIGETAKAQQLIIGELNKEFGGSAKAALDANPVIEIQKQFKEIQETVGAVIMQLIVELKPAIMTVVNALKNGVEWLSANWTTIRDVFSAIYEGVKIATIIFSPFLVVMAALEAAIWLQNLAWLANPLIWIPAVVVGVIAAFTLLYRKVEWFRAGIQAIFAGLKAYFFGYFTFMKDIFMGIGELIIGVLTLDVSKIKEGFNKSTGAFVTYAKGIKDAVVTGYQDGVKEVQKSKLPGVAKQEGFMPGLTGVGAGAGTTTKKELAKGMSSITDGGKASKNVTVNISSLIKEVNIKAANVKESTLELERIIIDAVVRAIGGAEEAI
jgi:hypothetical protein